MLTTTQLAALKADIAADPAMSVIPDTADGNSEIARLYNGPAAPSFVVFRKRVEMAEVGNAVNYVSVEAMTDANRTRITTFYAMNPLEFEPRSDIRSFWANTFSGALGGQGQATRDALEALWRRFATRAEKLFAVGVGTTVNPATLTFDGTVSFQDIEEARRT